MPWGAEVGVAYGDGYSNMIATTFKLHSADGSLEPRVAVRRAELRLLPHLREAVERLTRTSTDIRTGTGLIAVADTWMAISAQTISNEWCPREDSNLHDLAA